MRYLPHTESDIASMLEHIGARSLESLFSTIPTEARREGQWKMPPPLSEWDLLRQTAGLAGQMAEGYRNFIGAGCYEHFVPAIVPYLAGRSEFVTAYTPYQPEISQGTLQAIYEYQTLVSRLLGLEVANASLYDGASALAEALLMALRIGKKKTRVAVSRLVHPAYRQVIRTYLAPSGFEIIELPLGADGRTDLSQVAGLSDLAAVAVQSPNFFGVIEDLKTAADLAHDAQALLVASFTEPLAYGLLKSPGVQGADLACGEGQSFGLGRSFGGPGLGLMAARMEFVRSMPGRLVGQTVDLDGRRGFVLTLATREQHIRREKATSNICTNASHSALTAAMYLAALGGTGLKALARLNRDKAEYLKNGLEKSGLAVPFSGPTFNEFVVRLPEKNQGLISRLMAKRILFGLDLVPFYPELDGCFLVTVTETKSRQDLDELIEEVAA